MTNIAYTAVIIDNKQDRDWFPYAVATVTRGTHGFRLPSSIQLYFADYAAAQRQADALNDEEGIDRKEAALLALECIARGY